MSSIDVWVAAVDPAAPAWARVAGVLSPDERDRAARFVHPSHGAFFACCRGLLRTILADYARVPPGEIRLALGAEGKPELAWPTGPLSFNVAHSSRTVLVAVCGSGRAVGVDVERVRGRVDHETVAAGFLSPGERAALRRVPGPRRREAFFGTWTRKEAYLKARGTGMAVPLDAFEVTCPPEAPALLWAEETGAGEPPWAFTELDVGPGYAACLAVQGSRLPVRLRRWATPAGPRERPPRDPAALRAAEVGA